MVLTFLFYKNVPDFFTVFLTKSKNNSKKETQDVKKLLIFKKIRDINLLATVIPLKLT